MRKLFIGLAAVLGLLACIPLVLLFTGAINTDSHRMALNLLVGLDGPATTAAKVKQRINVPEGFNLSLYASDLLRAWETAEVVGRGLGMAPKPEPRMREFHVGKWSGCTKAEIDARWPGEYERFRSR